MEGALKAALEKDKNGERVVREIDRGEERVKDEVERVWDKLW